MANSNGRKSALLKEDVRGVVERIDELEKDCAKSVALCSSARTKHNNITDKVGQKRLEAERIATEIQKLTKEQTKAEEELHQLDLDLLSKQRDLEKAREHLALREDILRDFEKGV